MRFKSHQFQATHEELVSWVRKSGGKVWDGVDVVSTALTGLGLKTTKARFRSAWNVFALAMVPVLCNYRFYNTVSLSLVGLLEGYTS